ncbi:MAG: hypothetical protein Unbinned4944contig1000_18 [Prokaryotic dsDNA virus sp.]|nr:MAG: hypothetical protein Unbinned4944contig1000_18 [Prokaryotic dsDNA virus sp.]
MEVQLWIGCNPFERDPETLLVVDQIAKRYGRLPHEILELDVWELSLAMACLIQSDATSAQLMRRLNADSMPVFPVVVVRD